VIQAQSRPSQRLRPLPRPLKVLLPTVAVEKKRKMSFSAEAPVSPILTAAVITVSDSCARGQRKDLSGPAVANVLQKSGVQVTLREIVPDDSIQIQNLLIRLAPKVRLIVTTGGTGIAVRDVTPEATRAVCERVLDGVAERMRAEGAKKTPFAALSRAICGVRGTTLILNLPGSPTGAIESLEAVREIIPHALELLDGKTRHA
jgi:molybdopterin adenylyltransferase